MSKFDVRVVWVCSFITVGMLLCTLISGIAKGRYGELIILVTMFLGVYYPLILYVTRSGYDKSCERRKQCIEKAMKQECKGIDTKC